MNAFILLISLIALAVREQDLDYACLYDTPGEFTVWDNGMIEGY